MLDRALQQISDISAKYQEAVSKNATDETSVQNDTETALEYWRMSAMESGYPSLDQYLDDCYGGIREEDLRKVLEQEYTAQAFEEEYAAGFAPTEKEMRDYFESHREEFRNYSYLYGDIGPEIKKKAAAEKVCSASDEQEFSKQDKDVNGSRMLRIDEYDRIRTWRR